MKVLIAGAARNAFALLMVVLLAAPATTQAGSLHVTWKERIEVAAGDAYAGPWRMNDSEWYYVDDPTVAVNDQGRVGVAWADQANKDIFFQRYGPDGRAQLERPVNVSRSPKIFSWLPRITIASAAPAHVYILWQEIVFSGGTHGGEIFFARSTDGGETFSDPLNLSNTIAGAGKGRLSRNYWHNGSLDLALGPEGHLYVAWTEYEGALWFRRSADGGKSFSEPLRIAGSHAQPARGPSLAVAADDTVYVAWSVGEGRAADIHVAKSEDRGRTFGKPRTVFTGPGHADAPKVAADGKGTLHLVYAESPTGPWQRYRILYTRSRDKGRTFEKPREVSSPAIRGFQSAGFPALSLDGKGNPYLLWELFPDHRGRSQGLGFSYSTDGGRTFARPALVPGSADPALGFNGSRQGLLMRKLAVNDAGTIAVVNSTFNSGKASRIWLFPGQAARQ